MYIFWQKAVKICNQLQPLVEVLICQDTLTRRQEVTFVVIKSRCYLFLPLITTRQMLLPLDHVPV